MARAHLAALLETLPYVYIHPSQKTLPPCCNGDTPAFAAGTMGDRGKIIVEILLENFTPN